MREKNINLAKNQITVIYIAGYGRSGSTVLDLLIGNAPNCAGLGELAHFYGDLTSGSIEEEAIGSQRCIFWKGIGKQILPIITKNHQELSSIVYAQRMLENLFKTMLPSSRKHLRNTYQLANTNLFKLLAEETGCNIFVDSSKTTRGTSWRAARLAKLENVKVLVLHLIRDGRGVMLSQLKGDNMKMKKEQSDIRVRFPILKTIVGWNLANMTALILRMMLSKESVHAVFYEDLVLNPEKELQRISRMLDIDLSGVIQKIKLQKPIEGFYQYRGNRMLKCPTIYIENNNLKNRGLSLFATCVYWLFCAPMHLFLYGSVRRKATSSSQQQVNPYGEAHSEA
jgi:hypothetical protein